MNVMTKRGSLDNVITYEHICDEKADLANIPADQISLGSTAIVLQDENDAMEVYIANSDKEWIPISMSGGESGGDSSISDNYIELTLPEIDKSFDGMYEYQGSAPQGGLRKTMANIHLPGATAILSNALAGCTSLEAIDIPNVTRISASAFAGCSALKRVVLPKILSIDSNAFAGCTSVEYIYLGENFSSFASGCLGGVPVTCKVECGFAEGAVSGFPTNGGWNGDPSNLDITYNVSEPTLG